MGQRAIDQFKSVMKKQNAVENGVYVVSTSKRRTLTIPQGVRVYDEDEGAWYEGDGVTNGGVADGLKKSVRTVDVTVSDTCTDSGSDYSTFTWPLASGVRTGDALLFAAGGGTLPSGNPALSTVYVVKTDDNGNGANNTGTTFKIASSRANALSGSTITVLNSGDGWNTTISGVGLYGTESAVVTSTAGGVLTVACPNAASNEGVSVIVKRKKGTGSGVYVTEISGDGSFAASGSVDMGGAGNGSWLLKANTQDFVDLFSDGSSYQVTAKQITT